MNTFIINDRFVAYTGLNKVWDKKNDVEIKLEPRLVKLLCFLIDKRGELVTRDFLVKEIWDNYLGANEGLSQAVSFLRKVLDDGEKKMIRTLPKKGYSFHAKLAVHAEKRTKQLSILNLKRIAVAAFLVIFGINLFYVIRNVAEQKTDKQLPASELLREKGEQDAKNKAIRFYNIDSREQQKKLSQHTSLQ